MFPKFVRTVGFGVVIGASTLFGSTNAAMADHGHHGHCAPVYGSHHYGYRPSVVSPYYGNSYYGGYGVNVYRQPSWPAWNSNLYNGYPAYGAYGVGGFPSGGAYGAGGFPSGGGWGVSIYGR